MVHDITYNYGFDENAGNFQIDNFGKGGLDSDPVLIDRFVGNNAVFSTPPDGQPGSMSL